MKIKSGSCSFEEIQGDRHIYVNHGSGQVCDAHSFDSGLLFSVVTLNVRNFFKTEEFSWFDISPFLLRYTLPIENDENLVGISLKYNEEI